MERIKAAPRAALPTGQSNVGVLVQCAGRDDSSALTSAVAAAKGQSIVIGNGQTCAAGDLTIPNLRIEKGGLLKPLSSHTITLSENFEAGAYQVFTNAFARQGTISFSVNHFPGSVNPLWWATNATPGTTDMTAALQAAIDATGGRGKVFIPQGYYLIKDTLTVPHYSGTQPAIQAPLILEGEGPFLSEIINQASAGKPTLLINRDLVNVHGLGFWGANGFPNDGIKISLAGRLYLSNNCFFMNGNGVFLERVQSVWIQNNYGSVSSGSGIIPPPSQLTGAWTTRPTNSFVYLDIPAGGYVNHLIIRDNMNEGYAYKVYTNQSGDGYAYNLTIEDNQFEGGANGIYLKGVHELAIKGNYLGEGQSGYAIELNDCRHAQIGPNYIHFTSYTAKNSTVKLTNVQLTQMTGGYTTVWLTGFSNGLVFIGGQISRLIDETSDKLYGLFNVGSAFQIPDFNYQMTTGHSEWRSDSPAITAYPGARPGDRIWKKTPSSGASTGWICTTPGSTGALVQITGSGPDPIILPDYYQPTAYDFRITITSGGAVGAASYKVEYKPSGGASYANLATGITTTEVPRVVDEVLGAAFTIKWPSATYAAGDQWALTGVVAPVWKPFETAQ